MTTVLHMCAGIDGAGLGLGITPTWVADTDPDAASVLVARHPDTPNLGDIRTVDWAPLADQVDILVAGYPCQPFSQAGKRKGLDDPRHLWPAVRDAIAATRPRLVLLENVRGHLSLGFSDVLGDLADLGLDAEWGLFSSAEVGAPHRRDRLYIAAAHPSAAPVLAEQDDIRQRHGTDGPLLPTPTAVDSTGRGYYGGGFLALPGVARIVVDTLLPTPTRADGSGGPGRPTRSVGGLNLRDTARHLDTLLPTPLARDAKGTPIRGADPSYLPAVAPDTHDLAGSKWWPAVAQWADLCGTPPPPFVHHGPRGGTTIDARFSEWMMGFPAGWATDIARSNSAALRLVGNSIQPQTAALAWSTLVDRLHHHTTRRTA